MKITIAICTWNRCRLLKQTMEHIRNMEVPDSIEWELLIVDNCSTDATRQVVESFGESLPIRYEFESRQGHAFSRNCGVAAVKSISRADYIIWTDNDVIVNQNWLTAYIDGFKRHPDAGYFGGKIIPRFESGQPDWLNETWEICKAVFAARDLGDQELDLGHGVYPYGANFAVRADVQHQFPYDVTHGRNAGGMIGEDEIDVLRRIDSAGFRGVWLPDASLQHVIPAERATPAYVGRYFVGQGHTNILQEKVCKSSGAAFREFLHHQVAFWLKRHFRPPDEWVSHLIRASLSRGEYLALRAQRNGRTT